MYGQESADEQRKRAGARNRLSTSRGAKGGHKQQSARLYNGTGNIPRFVMTSIPEYRGDKRMLERALRVALKLSDNSNLDAVSLRQAMNLSRTPKVPVN